MPTTPKQLENTANDSSGPLDDNHPLHPRKDEAIRPQPCDGKPRFQVKGSVMAFRVPYDIAYMEIFRQEGCERRPSILHPGRFETIYTKPAVKRLAALNALYLSSPGVRDWLRSKAESERAARDLAKGLAANAPTPTLDPCQTPSPSPTS